MPDVDTDDDRRGVRPPTLLLWAGVGLAPLAGLILLLGGGQTATRAAAIVAVLAVVLIGLSIALRPDVGEVRRETEDMVLDEIDMLREDIRGDITHAARQTHQALTQRIGHLQQTVDTLRAEIDTLRAEIDAVRSSGGGFVPGFPAPTVPVGHGAGPPPGPGQPQATGQVHAAGRAHATGQVHPAGHPPVAAAVAAVPPGGPVSSIPDHARQGAAGRAHVPTGVVRHTETVHHVTTRSTFVGHHEGEDDRGAPYRGNYRSSGAQPAERADWGIPTQRSPDSPAEEESWTDQKLRERYGSRLHASEPDEPPDTGAWAERTDRRSWGGGGPAVDGEVFDPEPSRSRWSSRHADDRGEELRLGERRAAMRASDSGTEVRIEDRWAAVRRGWDRDEPEGRRGWDRDEPEGRRGWDRDEPEGRRERTGRRERRALPATPEAASWNADWEEPERESRSRRHRGDDYSSTERPFTFERSDERWR
jgi:hypothetical protein